MTLLEDRPAPSHLGLHRAPDPATAASAPGTGAAGLPPAQPSGTDAEPGAAARPLRVGRLVTAWAAVLVVGVVAVLLFVTPFSEQRGQTELLADYRTAIDNATQAQFGLPGSEAATEAPARGSVVGILDIPELGVRRAIIEGSAPSETERGPGHVVGTAGPGQPGNSVVVGRRSLFGGAFAHLGQLEEGDRIIVSSVQGQSVYLVEHVGVHSIGGAADPFAESPLPALGDEEDDSGSSSAALPDGPVSAEELYGPSDDDRLTLLTAAGMSPLDGREALVVIAKLDTVPFEPTPQGGRTASDDGRSGRTPFSAGLVLALFVCAAAVAASVWLFRTVSWRSAYLLSLPLLVAVTIVLAEQIGRTFPAWR